MSMYYTYVCDHCGERLDRPGNQLPRSWVVVSISSPNTAPRSEHWCQPCQQDLVRRTHVAEPATKRRIKTPAADDYGDELLVETLLEDVVPIDEREEEID